MKGKIYKGIGGFYYVITEDREIVECKARGKFRKNKIKPMIGDEVEVEVKNGSGSVSEIYPRRNSLIRPAVANIDMIVVTAAAKNPDPNTALIDKMLINAEINGLEAIVCINKCDMTNCDDIVGIYKNAGYKTVRVSAYTKEGIEELKSIVYGKCAAFAGVSGVGKSSLLTLITGSELETGEISEKISRGKHTTRHVELFATDGGGFVMDTPGFSSIEAEEIGDMSIIQCFPEMREYDGQCRFRGCRHINEPDCVVKQKVDEGEISLSRYESYKELYEIQRSRKQWK